MQPSGKFETIVITLTEHSCKAHITEKKHDNVQIVPETQLRHNESDNNIPQVVKV